MILWLSAWLQTHACKSQLLCSEELFSSGFREHEVLPFTAQSIQSEIHYISKSIRSLEVCSD
uniref:Uncharacterized protein n=1 Tax=Pygocentrus nattereri TaxID=42514 RepID=A0AAR2LBL1_PYGNA